MSDNKLFPLNINQNPSPVREEGQDYERKVQAQVENIMASFQTLLADTYQSEVPGPNYWLQYEALIRQLAKVQIAAGEVFHDGDVQCTRPEFLYQIMGALVFPDGDLAGIPRVEGDVSYRTFIQQMMLLLLEGSKVSTLKSGIELLTDATVSVLEKGVLGRDTPGSAWGFREQFSLEVNIINEMGTAFPDEDPFVLEENVRLVMRALKPAHVLYEYRHLFFEMFDPFTEDTFEADFDIREYDDFRKYCNGAVRLAGTTGETLSLRNRFRDTSRNFDRILTGSVLTLPSGNNEGLYRVANVVVFPGGNDTVARAYITSPTGLSGTLTVSEDTITDSSQDFGAIQEGEILTITEGPNTGVYRLEAVLGINGGLAGSSGLSGDSVEVAASILEVTPPMPSVETGQSYEVVVDRLGVKLPQEVASEDASIFFVL